MSIGDNVETEWWSFAGTAPDAPSVEPFLKFMYTLGNTSDAPSVFSFSYGDVESAVPEAYAERCNVEFQKAGVRGISLIFASGDGGIAGNRPVSYCGNTGCAMADESQITGPCFVATWPASSPYVTSVGGTSYYSGQATAGGQSCGGFSYRFQRPSYQETAVQAYLAKNGSLALPEDGRFNQKGRAFPDVAAMFYNYQIYAGGLISVQSIGGTSASAPVFAGIVSLLNDLRLSQGSSPLGFLNPLLYQNPDAMQDITTGSNGVPYADGCNSDGFPATAGWDGVTGLGEPNYEKLAQIVMATARQGGSIV
jgi:tripeptidyl-peptidase-1